MFFSFSARSVLKVSLCAITSLALLNPVAQATKENKPTTKTTKTTKTSTKATHDKPAAAEPAESSAEIKAQVRKSVESVVGAGTVEAITKTSYGNLYEVLLGNGDIVYADAAGSYLLAGALFDVKAKRNVTQAREKALSAVDISTLPLSQAIKQVKGNGKRIMITFEDANCGFCKKLAKDFENIKDVTIYTFMIPLLSPDSGEKAKNIWCATDKAKAWASWMVHAEEPAAATCDNPIVKNGELARKIRIKGTPTIFLADSSRIGGYLPPAELDQAINDAEKKMSHKK